MAKLYSRTGATLHEEPEYGQYKPDAHGAFLFPDDLSDRLLRLHVRKRRMWEDEEMRAGRMHQESEDRQRDPAVLYAAVTELVQMGRNAQEGTVSADLAAELAELRKELAELRESAGAGAASEAKTAPKAKAATAAT